MSEVKIFRIIGFYTRNRVKYLFRRDVRAIKEEDALEKVISQVTSKNLLRRSIKIKEIKEIKLEETEDMLIREISSME
jgi:ribosomal protein L20A (L18A)